MPASHLHLLCTVDVREKTKAETVTARRISEAINSQWRKWRMEWLTHTTVQLVVCDTAPVWWLYVHDRLNRWCNWWWWHHCTSHQYVTKASRNSSKNLQHSHHFCIFFWTFLSQWNVSSSSVNADIAFLWERSKFDPYKIQTRQPITIKLCKTDYVHETKSTVRERLAKYVKYKASSFVIFSPDSPTEVTRQPIMSHNGFNYA